MAKHVPSDIDIAQAAQLEPIEAIAEKIGRLAAWLGRGGDFEDFLQAVLDLREAAGVPHTLDGLGVYDQQIDMIAEMAVADPTAASNPVELTEDGAKTIFRAALSGSV